MIDQYNQPIPEKLAKLPLNAKQITNNSPSDSLDKVTKQEYPIDISFQNLRYTVDIKKKNEQNVNENVQKVILNSVNGFCKSGTITAIMGASGAGKTSLLNVLAKRIKHEKNNNLEGTIKANDQEYTYHEFSNFASYIMQDDRLLEALTVKETLMFTAKLKLNKSAQEAEEVVNKVIREIKLDRCSNHLVGGKFIKGISGGERKRTSIAIELLSNPHVLFLDEPTSGLDSFTAYIVINQLKQLAKEKNKTVIFTIHSPSSDIFNLFDNFMLLVKGNFVYQGSVQNVIPHFKQMGFACPETSNPADYLMSIVHHESQENVNNYPKYFQNYSEKIEPQILQSIKQRQTSQIPIITTESSTCKEINEIFKRSTLVYLRDPMMLKARAGNLIFLAVFVSLIYWQMDKGEDNPGDLTALNDYLGFLFYITQEIFMNSMFPVILSFPAERAVFLREENSKQYSTFSYFMGKSLQEFPFLIVLVWITSIITYFACGVRLSVSVFFQYGLVNTALAFAANSIGTMAGTLFPDPKMAIGMMPTFFVPLLIFSGFYGNSDDIWPGLAWIEYISPFKYGFSSHVRNEFEENNFNINPIEILNLDIGFWLGIILLVAMFFLYRIIAFFCLYKLKKVLQ